MATTQKPQYLADSPPTVVPLSIKPHFEALDKKSQLYSHYLSVAAYSGTRIVLRQCSPESEHIYDLIIGLYNHCNGDWKALRAQAGLSDVELNQFLDYSAQFLGNGGNYKSFGDSKFVPRLSEEKFKGLAACSKETLALYEQTGGRIYPGSDAGQMHLGYIDAGHVSEYYPSSPTITKEEITVISEFLDSKNLLPENTRLRKTGDQAFEVLIASAETDPGLEDRDVQEIGYVLEGKLAGAKLGIVYGDHNVEMRKIAKAMKIAQQYAANDAEEMMTSKYHESFKTGSLEAFKESQRYWIRDKGPKVETNIGFIETYRDPHGIKGEWEGFVAMVNVERTKAFTKLVDMAPACLPKLPWSKEFERDKFISPDFTSLEVLTFASSGIPGGINIPNYNDIRQEGFKNVSLGNVLGAKAPNEPIPFIKSTDLGIYQKYRDASFEVQVGLHELLGHGSGKLLQETSTGTYNFDIKNPPTNPLTQKPVTSWYKPGQTWGSQFGALAGTMEECRAELVAMLLCCDFKILSIFGFGDGMEDMDGEAGDILYAMYLSMARAGIIALETWDPTSRRWGQPHMQARFAILQTFLQAGQDFASLDYTKEDLSDLTIKIKRSKILTHGRPAVESFLLQLGIFKATADVEAGTKMYVDITTVIDWWGTKVRDQVMLQKTPRKVFVQANTVVDEMGESVSLKEYESTPQGMIQSFAERTYI